MGFRKSIKAAIARSLASAMMGFGYTTGTDKKGREKAEFFLDKGIMSAPSWLSREDQITWVFRKRPAAWWNA